MSGWKWKGDANEYIPGFPAQDISEEELPALAEARNFSVDQLRKILDSSKKYEKSASVKAPKPGPLDGPVEMQEEPQMFSDLDPALPRPPHKK